MLVNDISIDPPIALAPMVGVSHSAFRRLLGELGGVGVFFSEMLDVRRLKEENPAISPLLIKTSTEFPVFYQIFLADDTDLESAVQKLETLAIQGIDVNLGCPAPQLRRISAGAFLAEDWQRVQKILTTLRKLTRLPVSAKIRLGSKREQQHVIDFCRMLEDCGINLLTVHGRFQDEKFCRKPHWDWIGCIKEKVRVPVLANGGIFDLDDARNCLKLSGADGLMLGRGIAERPWLASVIAREVYHADIPEIPATKKDIYFRFVELLQESFAVERQIGRLKQFTAYYARSFFFGHHLFSAVQSSRTLDEAKQRAHEFFVKFQDIPE